MPEPGYQNYQQYSYPSDITEDRYEHRKVLITVKQPTIAEGASAAMSKALQTLDNNFDKTVNEAFDLIGIKTNLDANSKKNEGTTVGSIILPLPNAFHDSQSHGWTRETGIIGAIGQGLMSTTLGDVAGVFGSGAANIANKITGGASADKMLGSASSQMGTRKPLVDPGYFQNYTGSEPRTFIMTFDLVPKNAEEANQILMILFKLKQWASPTKQISGVTLLAPNWFNIELSNEYISALSKIDRVVLSEMNVDYGADGAMQQTADGMPKYMTLNLTFQEADMTTADDYNTRPRKSR